MSLAKVLLAIALVAPGLALAAGTAKIQGDDKVITVEFDGPLVRMQVPDQKNVHVIARDGKIYAVTNMGGSPMVVESSAMIGMLGSKGLADIKNGKDGIQKFVSLEPTGAKETVAGLAGSVYKLTYIDEKGQRRAETAVLGSQPLVVELTRSMSQLATQFMRMAKGETGGAADLAHELEQRKLGILSFGDQVRLISLDAESPDPSRFVLPAAPMDLPKGLGDVLQGIKAR